MRRLITSSWVAALALAATLLAPSIAAAGGSILTPFTPQPQVLSNKLGYSGLTASTQLTDGSTFLKRTYRIKITLPLGASGPVRFAANCGYLVGNSAPVTDTACPNAVGFRASISNGTTTYPISFLGSTDEFQLHGRVLSDPLAIPAPAAGSTWWICVLADVTSTNKWPQSRVAATTAGEGVGADGTDSTGSCNATLPSNAGGYLFTPIVAVVGKPLVAGHSIGILGDSIWSGAGDGGDVVNGYYGPGERAYTNTLPWMQLSRSNDRAVDYNTGHMFRMGFGPQYVTDIVTDFPRNDIYNGATLASVKATFAAFVADLNAQGIRVWASTILPTTTTVDQYLTASGQSISGASNNTVRVGWDDALRAGQIPNIAGYVEAANAVECNSSNVPTVDGGLWCTSAIAITGDFNATSTVSNVSAPDIAAISVGDSVNPPAGCTTSNGLFVNSKSTTSFTLNGAATCTAASQTIVIRAPTFDGTHPHKEAGLLVAAQIAATVH